VTHREDHYGRTMADLGYIDTPLFNTPAQRKADRERLKERLLPLVLALAKRRGPEGITASEVLAEALVVGTLTPAPSHDPRRHAWLGPWLGQLARLGILTPKMVRLPDGGTLHVTRKSVRHTSKQNAGGVYLDPAVAA
jgi:hypothetical protein